MNSPNPTSGASPRTRYTIEPGPYARAVALMRALRAVGIECGEDVGCVAIYCTEAQLPDMLRVCQEVLQAQPHQGSDSALKQRTTTFAGADSK